MANPAIFGPLSTPESVNQNLGLLGLSAPEEIPKSWDWSTKVKLLPPTNQAHCGNCWAQSSTNALTDKFLIFKKLKGLELNQLVTTAAVPNSSSAAKDNCKDSAQIPSGQPVNMMCGGGTPFMAGKFFEHAGAAPVGEPNCNPTWEEYCKEHDACQQIPIAEGSPAPVPGISANTFKDCKLTYRAAECSTQALLIRGDPVATINKMKTQMMLHGPIVGTFQVFTDFPFGNGDFRAAGAWSYHWDATKGVYVNGSYDKALTDLYNKSVSQFKQMHSLNSLAPNGWGETPQGWHAVEIVGWDDNGYTWDGKNSQPSGNKIPYWIIKNSWGMEWNAPNGKPGYWKHAMWPWNQHCFMEGIGGQGGSYTWEADLRSGGKYGETVGKAESGGSVSGKGFGKISKHTWMIILWIVLGIVGIVVIVWIAHKLFHGRKRKGSYS